MPPDIVIFTDIMIRFMYSILVSFIKPSTTHCINTGKVEVIDWRWNAQKHSLHLVWNLCGCVWDRAFRAYQNSIKSSD